MYTTVLILHSWLRWVALIAVFGVVLAAIRGKVEGSQSISDRWGMVAMMALDLQLLLGLILYFVVSPNMQEIRAHFGEAMQNPQLRFWAVEHLTAMIVAVVVAHVGRVLARKAKTPDSKRRRLLACFGVVAVALLLGTPWPGMPAGRPLFRI
jgi:hypothetical protein